MTIGEEVVFYEVMSDPARIEDFWSRVEREGSLLRLRSLSGAEMWAKARLRTADGWLEAEIQGTEPIPFRPNETLTVWIEPSGLKCFLEGVLRFKGNSVLIPLKAEINQQQKRKSFRLEVPESYAAFFEVESPSWQVRVKDLNTFGLGLSWPSAAGHPPDRMRGRLKLGEHPPVQLAGEIRFRHQLGDSWTLGLRLDHSIFSTEDELQALTLLFRRDIFESQKDDSGSKE